MAHLTPAEPLPRNTEQLRKTPEAVPPKSPPSISRLQLALFLPLLALTAGILMAYATFQQPGWIAAIDFAAFYRTALAYRLGVPAASLVTAQPSLSPPTLGVLLWPLTWLPLVPAFLVWSAISAWAFLASVRLMLHARGPLSESALLWLLVAVIGTMPFTLTWTHGQLTFVLGYLFTRAWLSSSPWGSAFWLGCAVAIKPPVALMVLALPWPVLWRSGVAAIGVSGIGLLSGVARWQEWLATTRTVAWIDLPYNASFWGAAARLVHGHALSDLSAPVAAIVLGLCVGVYAEAWSTEGDHRWAFAGLTGILVSPIGWITYLPIAIGPLLATWPCRSWLLTLSLTLLAVPGALMLRLLPYGGVWIYPLGTWCLWLAYLSTSTRRASSRATRRLAR